jgi:pimeloyl-ACP methyl ester carboxylesterase
MALRFRGAGSLDLAADAVGPWDGPPCLLLHGGGQTRHAWGGTTRALGDAGFLALTLDQRGHGESDWASDADYSPDAYVADLRAVLDQIGRPTALVGASLGGLASLLAAGEPPGARCSALVLVDITPRLDPAGRERIGRFMGSNRDGFASLEEAADAVAAYLPHRTRPADVSGLARNLRLEEDGRYHWHWDPAFVTSNWPPRTYQQPERYERAAAAVDVPILLVRGARSEIVSEEAARAFLQAAPSAEYVDVAGAAHMVAGDRNDAFTAAVVEFLRRRVLRD